MADEAHVKLFKERGVEAWNKWRKANHEFGEYQRYDLRFVGLGSANLAEMNLVGLISGVPLDGTNISGANLLGGERPHRREVRRATERGVAWRGESLGGAAR